MTEQRSNIVSGADLAAHDASTALIELFEHGVLAGREDSHTLARQIAVAISMEIDAHVHVAVGDQR